MSSTYMKSWIHWEMIDLNTLNKTELLQLIARPSNGGYRIRDTVTKERLLYLLDTGEPPAPEELALTTQSRRDLELWIHKTPGVHSQLPCVGPNKGKCTIYPCSEGRHLMCNILADMAGRV